MSGGGRVSLIASVSLLFILTEIPHVVEPEDSGQDTPNASDRGKSCT